MNDEQITLVTKALKHAYQLGQTYWQQADSESRKQWALADATRERFSALVDETCAALAAPSTPQGAPEALSDEQIDALFMTLAKANEHGAMWLRTYGEGFRHIARAILALAAPSTPKETCEWPACDVDCAKPNCSALTAAKQANQGVPEALTEVELLRDALQQLVDLYGTDSGMWNQARAALAAPVAK